MKKKLLIFFYVPLCLSLSGATYYIAPNGNDLNDGDISHPFATLNKVWTIILAGDIVYLRGGTYLFPTSQELTGKNGTAGNLIKIWAYPGEIPVLTKVKSGWTYRNREGIHFEGNYFHWKGIEITGFTSVDGNANWMGFRSIYSSHNIFELINYHHNGAGFEITDGCDDNLVLNSDFHHNYDPLTSGDPYGNADGAALNPAAGSTNTFKGCRFWSNSDDGLDMFGSAGLIIVNGCWSWGNGYREDGVTKGGDGNGFKLGNAGGDYSSTHLRTVINCLAFHNRQAGFTQNRALCISYLYNNTAFHNADGSDVYSLNFAFDYGTSIAHILRNNIAYANQHPSNLQANWDASSTQDHNTWNGGVTVTDADFLSLDATGVDGPRQTDGSLPDINFLNLAKGSDLIDAGIDVGLQYSGKAPDLGAFEFQSDLPAPIPVYVSSVIENATPSLLEMTYDLNLNSVIVPSISSFNVLVNEMIRSVNSVTISGNKVQLNLSSAVKFGDVITVSYTKPLNNPLQNVAGGEAVTFSSKTVTNNCEEPVKPNDPPVVVIKYSEVSNSGFVYEIDASGSYDLNSDILTFEWTIPNNVSVSSTNSSKIQFLAPIANTSQNFDFQLKVNDGKATVSKSIVINIIPYKPELAIAKIKIVTASSYQAPDFPNNVSDDNFLTLWSANGDNQWLFFSLSEPFKISHLEIAFFPGQRYSSYFDIYASQDNLLWEPILNAQSSCNFSGGMQVFDFPASKTNTEYLFLKYVGHGNILNRWNHISEFKIFGTPHQYPISGNTENINITIFPNPVRDVLNISNEEPNIKPDKMRIIDLSGKIVFEEVLNPDRKSMQIPISLKSGVYIIQFDMGNVTVFAQKIIVIK